MNPLVNVIIPVYNAELTIDRCLNSVLNQTYKNIEIICIDDGSTDNSYEICKKYEKQYQNVKVIHEENKGVSSARNLGLENSTGQYIAFLDGDDAYKKNFIEMCVFLSLENNLDMLITSLQVIHNDGRKEHRGFDERKIYDQGIWSLICENSECFGWAGGKFIKRDVISIDNIHFCERMKSQEDLDFNIEVYHNCQTIMITDYSGYEYYYQPSNRVPPIDDFIRNQLKIMKYAKESNRVKIDSLAKINNRIIDMIYGYIYSSYEQSNLYYCFENLEKIAGLDEVLSTLHVSNEKTFIVNMYKNHKYKMISNYLYLRRKIKMVLRK